MFTRTASEGEPLAFPGRGAPRGRQYRAKSSFLSPDASTAPRRRKQRRSLPTHITDIVYLAAKPPAKHRKEVGAKRRSSASVLAPPSCGSHTYLSSMSECDENDNGRTSQISVNFNKERILGDSYTNIQRKFGYSNLAMSYEDFDIVGESFDHRFPWQRDISVQCCLEDNLLTRGSTRTRDSTAPVWNSYLPRERSASLTRGELPSHPLLVSPRSTGSLPPVDEHTIKQITSTSCAQTNNEERCMDSASREDEGRVPAIGTQGTLRPSPRVSPITVTDRPEFTFDSDSDTQQDPFNDSGFSPTKQSDLADDNGPSPSNVRRGRRAAVIDTKNIGDVSPTNMSPTSSTCSSDDETDGASSDIRDRLGSRGSFDVSVMPGDLLLTDHSHRLAKRNTIADLSSGPKVNSEDHRRGKSSFSLIKKMRARSKESLHQLEDLLRNMKPSEFKDNHLSIYKSLHWTDLIASSDKSPTRIVLPETERKRREAVWELFKAECVYLIDHLMVLKHCFMEPLKKVQVEGILMFAEPQDLLGNLDELCYVSYTFCKDFIASLLKDISSTKFGNTEVLLQSFERFTTHSRDGGVFHTYCLNYATALPYLHQLRKNDQFAEFEKWCSQDPRCNRLQLTDLLVAPLQHCTKFPLLLGNVKKYTEDEQEREALSELIDKVNMSLQKMEDKMKWAQNFERLQEIQKQLVWPPVSELAPRALVPEFLRSSLLRQPCEQFLATEDRRLLFEGIVTLNEITKSYDIYLFVFDDVILLTKPKKIHRKKLSLDSTSMMTPTISSNEKQSYTLYRQPIPTDRLSMYDVSPSEASAQGFRHVTVLVQYNRYQQVVDVLTLQCPSETVKSTLMEKLHEAIGTQRTSSVCTSRTNSLSDGPT